jgi:GDP-L-fucose synthase
MHVDDLAAACVFAIQNYDSGEPINLGVGVDISIYDLALLVKKIVGFDGDIVWDSSKPDGTPRKLLDTSTLNNLGWTPKVQLEDGIKCTYEWYLDNLNLLA